MNDLTMLVSTRTLLARELAVDSLAAWEVPGAPQWAASGKVTELARPWRLLLVASAERIAERLKGRLRGENGTAGLGRILGALG